jgi:hypothetical protein
MPAYHSALPRRTLLHTAEAVRADLRPQGARLGLITGFVKGQYLSQRS